jgi:hypothetical protein
MNEIYVLTNRLGKYDDNTTIVTQEVLNTMGPIPATTSVTKYVPADLSKNLEKELATSCEAARLLQDLLQQRGQLITKLQAEKQEWEATQKELLQQLDLLQDKAAAAQVKAAAPAPAPAPAPVVQVAAPAVPEPSRLWHLDITPYYVPSYGKDFSSKSMMEKYCAKLEQCVAFVHGPNAADHNKVQIVVKEIELVNNVE